jgi:hypothetical protein
MFHTEQTYEPRNAAFARKTVRERLPLRCTAVSRQKVAKGLARKLLAEGATTAAIAEPERCAERSVRSVK